ncbi:putative AbiEii toxin of type IV toxin-antitoxin system [Fluviicoccus keumensis]|uniref:Putative AbiEii toxin of type IV toxin-antitoxin system n=1 Tax=Fluviicoccus keumensis TaxID=1435465 RepID=A0A4Q7YPD6_9GAMM|nr:AAA family ATPase [Fluviicoccus keumensis]RZU38733.1 putative AbiEii toxin of type IV toxin-antitoxin system [Fluviicoccus keumensis]
MKILEISIENFRSIKSIKNLKLGQINIFIGENNSGKSSILRAIHLLQDGSQPSRQDIRIGSTSSKIDLLVSPHIPKHTNLSIVNKSININLSIPSNSIDGHIFNMKADNTNSFNNYPNTSPYHAIIPYLSKRKTSLYSEDVREESVNRIETTLSNLPARISKVSNSVFPKHDHYKENCEKILGFMVTSIPSKNGITAGTYVDTENTISISQMGEGVPNITSLVADLSYQKDKIFIIEEPENDLHPKALKAEWHLLKD